MGITKKNTPLTFSLAITVLLTVVSDASFYAADDDGGHRVSYFGLAFQIQADTKLDHEESMFYDHAKHQRDQNSSMQTLNQDQPDYHSFAERNDHRDAGLLVVSANLPKADVVLLPNGSRAPIKTLEEFIGTTTPARSKIYSSQGMSPLSSPSSSSSFKPHPTSSERKSAPSNPPTGSIAATGKQHGGHVASPALLPGGVKPIPYHFQVKSLLNVSHDYPLAYSQIICGYVWPVMALITLFTNLMIVFVLTQRDMRTPTNVVLTAIAIADIIPIVVPVPWFVYLFGMGNEKVVLYPPIKCYFYQHSTRSVSETFYFISTWLNVLLAIQDYLTACWPDLAKKHCKISVVVWEICALTGLAFVLNLPQALKLVFKPVQFYYQNQLTWGCRRLQAKWFKDLVGEYAALYDDIFTGIIVIFVDGGPAIALIILTGLLIRQLKRQRIQGMKLMEQARTASKRRRELRRQQEVESSARVLIFVLLAFLAVKIPFATTYTLMIIQSRFEIHFVENLLDFQKAITITDLVFVLSYPVNFTIFCLCSKRFRHKCLELLSRTARKHLVYELDPISGKRVCRRRRRPTKTTMPSFDDSNYGGLGTTQDDNTTIGTAGSLGEFNQACAISSEIQHRESSFYHDEQQQQRLPSTLPSQVIPSIQVQEVCDAQSQGNTRSDVMSRDELILSARSDPVQHQQGHAYKHLRLRRDDSFEVVTAGSNSRQNSPRESDFELRIREGILCYECIVQYEQLRQRTPSSLRTEFSQHENLTSNQSLNDQHHQHEYREQSSAILSRQQQQQQRPQYRHSHHHEHAPDQMQNNEMQSSQYQPGQQRNSCDRTQATNSDSEMSSLFDWPLPPDIQFDKYRNQANQKLATNQHQQTAESELAQTMLAPMGTSRRNSRKLSHAELGPIRESRSGSGASRRTTHGFTEHEMNSIDAASAAPARVAAADQSGFPDPGPRQSSGLAASGSSRDARHRGSWVLPHPNRLSISLSDSKLTTLPKATGMLADTMLSLIVCDPGTSEDSGGQQQTKANTVKRGKCKR